jgi:MscS family membrane protein
VILTLLVRYVLQTEVLLLGSVFEVVDISLVIACFLLAAVALLNLGAAISQFIIMIRKIEPNRIDAQLVNLTCRSVAWAVVILLSSYGASSLGVPIEAVVASFGVGGFAFAIAARPTLENLIAGVTLYLDKPVRIGDWCQFGDTFGAVEEIGLRSTRIRRLEGTLLTVPNAQFADYQLVNFSNMNSIRFRATFGLHQETRPEPLRFVLAKLREIFTAHPQLSAPRVRLTGVDEQALTVEMVAMVETTVWAEFFGIREDLYLRVLELLEQAGVRLSVPMQQTYFARDPGIDDPRAAVAAEQVKTWRENGELPFPDMASDQMDALHGTLDYPPAEWAGHKRQG